MSTSEQDSGLRVQQETIEAAAAARGWEIVGMYADRGASGRSMDGRPGLAAALEAVESGVADALVVARLDRLSRSLLDFAGLMERSRRNGWSLVALDLGVDTSTPSGEMMANVLAAFAQFERRLIGQRTAEALALKKAAGVRLRRPPVPDAVRDRIVAARAEGRTLRSICDELNRERVPTGQGAERWWPETVRGIALAATRGGVAGVAMAGRGGVRAASSARSARAQNGQTGEATGRRYQGAVATGGAS